MKMLTAIKITILAPHQTIQHVARRMGMFTSFLVPRTPFRFFVAQVQHFFQNDAAQMLSRPVTKPTDALAHDRMRFRIINVPNPLADLEELFLQILRPFANAKPRMKKTANQNNLRKQRKQRPHRTGPTIGVDGLWRVFRFDFFGFGLEDAVGVFQLVLRRSRRHFRAEKNAFGYRRRDVRFFAADLFVVFVDKEVFRYGNCFHGRSDDAVATETEFQSIPKSRVASVKSNDGPVRYAEFSQEQTGLDVFGAGDHHGQDEGGADLVLRSVSQGDATNIDVLSFGMIASFHFVPFLETGRKEFRAIREERVEPFPAKLFGMINDFGILLFRNGQRYGTLSVSSSRRRGFVGHDSPPCFGRNKVYRGLFSSLCHQQILQFTHLHAPQNTKQSGDSVCRALRRKI